MKFLVSFLRNGTCCLSEAARGHSLPLFTARDISLRSGTWMRTAETTRGTMLVVLFADLRIIET